MILYDIDNSIFTAKSIHYPKCCITPTATAQLVIHHEHHNLWVQKYSLSFYK